MVLQLGKNQGNRHSLKGYQLSYVTPYPQRSKPRTHFIIPAIVVFREAGMMRPS
jgi:hypothetical protein